MNVRSNFSVANETSYLWSWPWCLCLLGATQRKVLAADPFAGTMSPLVWADKQTARYAFRANDIVALSRRRVGAAVHPDKATTMPAPPRYWFPAKRYGWGWGLPRVWQGWVVLAVFVALLAAGAVFLLPLRGPIFFAAYVVVSCALLTAVCWMKGEPPRWRWGDRE